MKRLCKILLCQNFELYCIPTYVAYCIVVIYMYLNVVLSLMHHTTNMHWTQHVAYVYMQPFTNMYMRMPYSGFFKAETRFSPQKTISSALVSIVLSRVTPGMIKITLFALVHFAYLFMSIC